MRFPYLVLSALYCWMIFIASSDSDPPKLMFGVPHLDKVVHFIFFGGLAAIVSLGLRYADRIPQHRTQFFAPVAFAMFYGISDEIHQLFVPLRTFSVADIAADTCGALAIQLFLCFYLWRIPRNLAG
jgi:VanZ family protein